LEDSDGTALKNALPTKTAAQPVNSTVISTTCSDTYAVQCSLMNLILSKAPAAAKKLQPEEI
jgi:hypothetical protein